MQINRLPGIGTLAKKRENFWSINLFKRFFPAAFSKYKATYHQFFPETFLMPDDFNKYVISHSQMLDSTFISKTSKGRQGKGIMLLKHPRDLGLKKIGENDDIVIQRYIDDPLLIDNKKHDLRLYLVILSLDPLIAFLNEEGLARFCTQDYQKPNQLNMNDASIHLTNYSLNKHCENYEFSEEVCEENSGSKRTLQSYWKSVQAHRLNPKYVG